MPINIFLLKYVTFYIAPLKSELLATTVKNNIHFLKIGVHEKSKTMEMQDK